VDPVTVPDRLLDDGAPGLEFFAAYLPCVHRLGRAGHISVEFLRERYDEQRGLDTDALAADVPVLTRLAGRLTTVVDEQARGARSLGEAWTGGVGAVAHRDVADTVLRGESLTAAVGAVAAATAAAADGIVAAVAEKSRGTAEFTGATVDGRSAADVDLIISGAEGVADTTHTGTLARWCAESGAPPGGTDTVEDWCRSWLRGVFEPQFEAALDRFVALCDTADAAVVDLLDGMVRAFGEVGERSNDSVPAVDPNRPPNATLLGAPERFGVPAPAAAVAAARDLVDAGHGLAEAVTGLAAAVTDLAAAAVHATAEGIEALGPAEGAGAVGPAEGHETAGSVDRRGPVGAEPPTGGAVDGGPQTEPERSSSEPASSGEDTVPRGSVAVPEGSASEGHVPAGTATAEPGHADAAHPTVPDPDPEPDDGVVLAEAGPL